MGRKSKQEGVHWSISIVRMETMYYLLYWKWSEGCLVMSNSLWPHGLYSPWNSPGQNAGAGSLSLLQGIFPTQGLNPGLHIAGRFFTRWATGEAPFMKGKHLMSICHGRTILTGGWLTIPHPDTALEEFFADMISCGQPCWTEK